MSSAYDICRKHGIALEGYSLGSHRTTCPQCSHLRKPVNRRDPCLVVTIKPDDVVWYCHHCGAAGGATGRKAERPSPREALADDTAERVRRALKLWDAGRDPRGTLVDKYLDARSLSLPASPDIRFYPHCPFRLFENDSVVELSAMLALMRDIITDEPRGVHKTALKTDGSGKADIRKPRRMIGVAGNTAIKLSPDDEVTMGLGIAEGVETALSVIGLGWVPLWALGSAGAIERFPVLPGVEALTIFTDHDESGDGMQAASHCKRVWIAAACEVRIHVPQKSGFDWNDIR